jgi:hypothetical protein
LHPEYQDCFEAHLSEILERYGSEVDGFFVDILMMHSSADWSESGLRFREEHGLMGEDNATFRRFEAKRKQVLPDGFRVRSLVQGQKRRSFSTRRLIPALMQV